MTVIDHRSNRNAGGGDALTELVAAGAVPSDCVVLLHGLPVALDWHSHRHAMFSVDVGVLEGPEAFERFADRFVGTAPLRLGLNTFGRSISLSSLPDPSGPVPRRGATLSVEAALAHARARRRMYLPPQEAAAIDHDAWVAAASGVGDDRSHLTRWPFFYPLDALRIISPPTADVSPRSDGPWRRGLAPPASR